MTAERIIGRRWRVLRLVGTGGMGSVYEVEHVELGTIFAIKQLKLELADDEVMVRSFVREARRLIMLGRQSGDQAVRHIVQVEDLETDDDLGIYIRMEMIRGENLTRYRQRGAFPFPEVVRIGSEIALALGLAHRNNLIHCDVKPANILIEENTGRAVVTDFGISKRIRSSGNDETATTTSVGGLTTRYAAPEQVRGDDIDQRVDLYALGCVLYEMASGRRFIDELKDDIPIAVKKAAAGWRPALPFTQPVPAKFVALLNDLLESSCEKRVPEAAHVVERLQECLKDFTNGDGLITPSLEEIAAVPSDEAPPTVLEVDRRQHEELTQAADERVAAGRNRTLPIAATAALAVVVVAALLYTYTSQPTMPAPQPLPASQAPIQPRPPSIASVDPDSTVPVSLHEDENRAFSIKIVGDAAQAKARWTLDDKQVASDSLDWSYKPGPDAARSEPHILRVAIGAGDRETQTREWKIQVSAASRPQVATPVDFVALPAKFASLKFQGAQSFEAKAPPGVDPRQVAYLWTVNGEKAADTPSFQFAADNPQLVGAKPVTISVNARDDKGHTFKHDWQFKIAPPPAPKIASVQPPADQLLKAMPGSANHFELTMSPAIAGQTFGYVFSVNGQETRSSTPTFELTPEAGHDYTIVAYATDNFGQSSERKSWKLAMPTVAPPSLGLSTVESWLDAYRQALVQKNVDKLQDLLQLSAAKVSVLQQALTAQCDLKVEFKDTKVDQLAADRYRARYERVDNFKDCNTSEPISKSTNIEQTFRVNNGKVELEKAK
ncbi:MAG TPA: serine/threonine-protein kinase [Candidatus Acidoferrales bacterium]|nr:serine/threonine-protein kinase [Candidatus Acidoferrales bacterium]